VSGKYSVRKMENGDIQKLFLWNMWYIDIKLSANNQEILEKEKLEN
jgi:hypothetical protein